MRGIPLAHVNRSACRTCKVIANARLVDLNDFSHPFGLLVLVHSQLLSESLKGTAVKSKCAKDSVRYQMRKEKQCREAEVSIHAPVRGRPSDA